DRLLMLEHSIYTVPSPEALAAHLRCVHIPVEQAAETMLFTAPDLLKLGIIDGIVPEPAGGAHLAHTSSAQFLGERLRKVLAELTMFPICHLLEQRPTKFRPLGHLTSV